MRATMLLLLVLSVGCKAPSHNRPVFIGQVQLNFALHQDNSLER